MTRCHQSHGNGRILWRAVLLLAPIGVAASAASAADRPTSRKESGPSREEQLEAALRKKSLRVLDDYCDDLAKVASWAAGKGLRAESTELAARIQSLYPEYEDLEKVRKATAGAAEAADDAEKARADFQKRLESADEEHAKRLYRFAEQCFRYGLFTRAYALLLDVLELAPDARNAYQKKARKVLGYAWDAKGKKWIREWEARQKKTSVLTKEGWVAKKDLKKWEKGQRPYKGKWVTIEEEKRIRGRNEYNPYQVESEHFVVLSNLGREQAWKYSEILESFQQAFYRTFLGYYDQSGGKSLLFKSGVDKKHRVYVFPSRDDYLTHVKGEQGNSQLLRESAGFYSPADRISRFYWSDDIESTLSTLYHEVAHQLFDETKETRRGSADNNWVIEGLATYVETWEKKDGKWRAGRNLHTRELQRAKEILANPGGFSLRAFVAIDNKTFHESGRGDNYCLSGALTHFLMHFDDEVYREDFMRFVSAFYDGKVRRESLVEYLKGVSGSSPAEKFATLEAQLREYVKSF